MFKDPRDCMDFSKDAQQHPMKLEQFKTTNAQVVVGINPISLDHEDEDNQLIKYSW